MELSTVLNETSKSESVFTIMELKVIISFFLRVIPEMTKMILGEIECNRLVSQFGRS